MRAGYALGGGSLLYLDTFSELGSRRENGRQALTVLYVLYSRSKDWRWGHCHEQQCFIRTTRNFQTVQASSSNVCEI